MEPSRKSRSMTDFLEAMSQDMFGRSRIESIKSGVCVDCGGPAVDFTDARSQDEYTISGLCQKCQDKIWG